MAKSNKSGQQAMDHERAARLAEINDRMARADKTMKAWGDGKDPIEKMARKKGETYYTDSRKEYDKAFKEKKMLQRGFNKGGKVPYGKPVKKGKK